MYPDPKLLLPLEDDGALKDSLVLCVYKSIGQMFEPPFLLLV